MRMICLIVNCMKLARYISIYIYSGLLHRSFPRLPTTTYRRIRQTISFSCARSAIWLGMSVLRENAFAAYFACCRIFHIFQQSAHIAFFPHKLAFSTAILILFVSILPVSIRFRYLNHLVANGMAPSMCPEYSGPLWSVERGGVVGFEQFCTIFPPHIWCLCGPHIF